MLKGWEFRIMFSIDERSVEWCRVNICDFLIDFGLWVIVTCSCFVLLQSWINQKNFTRGIGAFVKGVARNGSTSRGECTLISGLIGGIVLILYTFHLIAISVGFVFSVTNSRSFRYFTINEGSLAWLRVKSGSEHLWMGEWKKKIFFEKQQKNNKSTFTKTKLL
jgi:hypothetical protein